MGHTGAATGGQLSDAVDSVRASGSLFGSSTLSAPWSCQLDGMSFPLSSTATEQLGGFVGVLHDAVTDLEADA